jgi:hypothetical protein
MSFGHRIYLICLVLIAIVIISFVGFSGYSYYRTGLEERFFHENHVLLKPGGDWGHGFGIAGSLAMIIGMLTYMIRKRSKKLARFGLVKHWLEFHIFLCTLGPALVLFHTSFKFGGIVAVSFWSMVAVFLSGIIGRFIYIQIPRTIEGRELSLNELEEMRTNIIQLPGVTAGSGNKQLEQLLESARRPEKSVSGNFVQRVFRNYRNDHHKILEIRAMIKDLRIPGTERKRIMALVKKDIALNRRIERLVTMQNLFRYWHVAHLPFALVMLIIMVIHVIVTIVFGYHWIF